MEHDSRRRRRLVRLIGVVVLLACAIWIAAALAVIADGLRDGNVGDVGLGAGGLLLPAAILVLVFADRLPARLRRGWPRWSPMLGEVGTVVFFTLVGLRGIRFAPANVRDAEWLWLAFDVLCVAVALVALVPGAVRLVARRRAAV